jgi:predicted phosphodiesterase
MTPQKILFAGDTHGNFNQIMWLLQKASHEKADAIFVLGDFGIWDHLDGGEFTDLCSRDSKRTGIPIYFLPGNHENYDLLEVYEETCPRDDDDFVILKPGVLYSPRAHRWTWNDVRFLSLGGAYSVDKHWRVEQDRTTLFMAEMHDRAGRRLKSREKYALRNGQLSWWHQEEITEEERDRAAEGGEVDVMLTHDKPYESSPKWNRKDIPECEPNQKKIQYVVGKTSPSLLLHGHLHYAYGDVLHSTGTVVRGFDCDAEASEFGNRDLSYCVMTFLPEGVRGYTLEWNAETGLTRLTHSFHGLSDE